MTIAMVALDAASGALGAAITGVDLTASACAIAARPGVGIVASYGVASLSVTDDVLARLADGVAPEYAVRDALGTDPIRSQRQLLVVDARGRTAAHSGSAGQTVFGHTRGTDHAAGGELMASPNAVGAMSLSFERSAGDPLGERLLLALESGERAGGERRGARQARLVIFPDTPNSLLEIWVEDHPEPVAELRRRLEEGRA